VRSKAADKSTNFHWHKTGNFGDEYFETDDYAAIDKSKRKGRSKLL